VVLLAGDPHAKSDFLEHAPAAVRDLTMELGMGGRAEGTSGEAVAEFARNALEEVRLREWTGLWDSFRQGEGAILRWSDPATTRAAAPSMPGHGEQPQSPGTG
jgi:hypothetical protein